MDVDTGGRGGACPRRLPLLRNAELSVTGGVSGFTAVSALAGRQTWSRLLISPSFVDYGVC